MITNVAQLDRGPVAELETGHRRREDPAPLGPQDRPRGIDDRDPARGADQVRRMTAISHPPAEFLALSERPVAMVAARRLSARERAPLWSLRVREGELAWS